MRKLGIPTAVDRVLQQAIVQVLSPTFEPQFVETSYGFRPGRSAHDATILTKIMMEEPYKADEGILHHAEGVDLMPGNIELSAIEVSLVNTMSRETVLRTYINTVKDKYK